MYVLVMFLFFAVIIGGSRRVRQRVIARPPFVMFVSAVIALSFYSLRVVL